MLVPLILVGIALAMFGVELAVPGGRSWPKVTGWWCRALLLNALQAGVVWLSGVAWDKWMYQHRPWSVDSFGTTWGALFGYFVLTFVYYWWHRWRHEVDFLWRCLHQVHHSAQRIEVVTSFYKHPLEAFSNGLIVSALFYLVVGLNKEQAMLAILISGVAEFFYHWNVKTPYWLGFIVQRPESHCVHHQEGVHSYNFADLPLWDMLFGTFRNPRKFESRCGFGDAKEHRLGEMLICRDIANEPEPKGDK